MRQLRYLLLILTALLLLAPSALATGPSAGDQQYTDPLGGSNGTSNGNSSNNSSSGSGSSSSSPAPSSSTSSGATTSAASPASAATSATTPSSTSAQAGAGSLPRTGFNAWLGAACGVVLLATGLAVRRQAHRRPRRHVHGRYIL